LPNKIPAFGLSAVPLPTKNRRNSPSCQSPTADAAGDATAAPGPTNDAAAGSPVVAAAALAERRSDPNSRRAAANAAHANGAAAGDPPLPPASNHDNRFRPKPDTAPSGGAAVIAGA